MDMLLSRTAIVGPQYQFCGGNNGKLFVVYQFRDKGYRVPIQFFQERIDKDGHRLTVQVSNSNGESLAKQVSIIRAEEPHFLDLYFNRKYRSTGLVYVFHNMVLYHMVVTCKLDPAKIFIYNAIGNEKATFGAMALNIKLGISRLSDEAIRDFLIEAEKDQTPGKIEYLRGRKGQPIEVLRIGGKRVMFVPQLNTKAMMALTHDLEGLEYLLRSGYAYLDRSHYYILPEAARIMPDYVRLLPANPEVPLIS